MEKILKQYKIGKHCKVDIREDGFEYQLDRDALAAEVAAKSPGETKLAETQLARFERHIEAIAKKLDKIQQRTKQGHLHGQAVIGVRVGKVVNKYKMSKHFVLHIKDDSFTFEIDQGSVNAEAALDGIYVVRSSVSAETMDTAQTVRSYKLLSNVERAFRCLKSVDLMVRPIRHRLENRVKAAHLFVHARLLRPVAHDRSVAPVALRRRGSGQQVFTRPRGPRRTFGGGPSEGPVQTTRRPFRRSFLPHAARRSRAHRHQSLSLSQASVPRLPLSPRRPRPTPSSNEHSTSSSPSPCRQNPRTRIRAQTPRNTGKTASFKKGTSA